MKSWLKKLSHLVLFGFIPAQKTVASITSGVRKTIKELEAHAAEQIMAAKEKTLAAAKLLKERADHEEEHLAAAKTAQNFKALLG